MKKPLVAFAVLSVLFPVHGAATAEPSHNGPRIALAFHTMYGVDGPFVGEANAIRGVSGDDLPWEVEHFVNGTLTTNGHLKVVVRGLVFKNVDEVPPEKRGKNDEPDFRGVVSCLTESDESATPTVNVVSDGFHATEEGDADIDAKLDLPNPCVAPIVFVTGDDPSKWFAVTGFEKEEGD